VGRFRIWIGNGICVNRGIEFDMSDINNGQNAPVTSNSGSAEPPFAPVYLQGEALTILASTPASLPRTTTANPENPTEGLDAFGLRPGYTGTGYLDINGGAGAKASFSFDAPAGTYDIVVRLANGSTAGGTGGSRPITLTVDGTTTPQQTTNTGGWNVWQERVFTVTVTTDGAHTVTLNQIDGSNAPNIDAIAVVAQGAGANFAAPTAPATQAVATDEDVAVTAAIGAGDLDGDTLGYAVKEGAGPAQGSVAFDGGSFTYTPDADANGADSFTIVVSDGQGGTAEQVVSVTIAPVNDAAVITGDIAGTVTEDGTLVASGTLTVTDIDSDATVVAQTGTAGTYGTFSITEAGAWTYTLDNDLPAVQALAAGASLTETFPVATADGTTQDVTITIEGVDEPVGANTPATFAGDLAGTVTEDGTLVASGTLIVTDPDAGEALVVAQTAAGAYGSFAIDAAGAWSYTLDNANAAVQALAAGASLTETFTVASADGTTQAVTVTIAGTNDAAVITGTATGSVTEDAAPGTVTGALAVTDTDAGEAAFVAQTGTAGSYGSFAIDAAGAWSYTLDNANPAVQALATGASLTETFTVASLDGTGQAVTVTIEGADEPPFAPVYLQGEALTILASTPASLPRTTTANPENPTEGLDAFGLRPGYTGTGYLDINGGAGAKASFSFDAPAGTYDIVVRLANGSTAGGTGGSRPITLTVDGTTTPQQTTNTGGWNVWQERVFTVTVTTDGAHTVTLNQIDGSNAPNIDAIAVVAQGAGANFAAPTAPATQAVATDEDVAVTAAIGAGDLDGDTLGYAVKEGAGPAQGSVAFDGGSFTYTPDADANGADSFTIVVSDGQGGTAEQVVSVTIAPVNDAAVITGDIAGTVTEDGTLVASGTLTVTDIDSDATVVAQTGTAGTYGTFSITEAGAWTYTLDNDLPAVQALAAGASLTETFPVATADGTTQDVTITIEGVDEAVGAPVFTPLYIQGEALSFPTPSTPPLGSETVARTQSGNPENIAVEGGPADNTGPGKEFDDFGLRKDYTGTGYLDINGGAGDKASFTFEAPAGTYDIVLRVANGSTSANADNFNRPIALLVEGSETPAQTTNTGGWSIWQDIRFTVSVTGEGPHTVGIVQKTGSGAPNIDAVAILAEGGAADFGPPTDTSADEDANLALTGPAAGVSVTASSAVDFSVAGVDADIVKVEVSLDGGATRTEVTPDATGALSIDASELGLGDHNATVYVTDEAGNVASTTAAFSIVPVAPTSFTQVIEAEDLTRVTITDVDLDTVVRTQGGLKENSATEANSGPGLIYDAFGLRPGYSGTGYLDPGNDVGDKFAFSVETPEAGAYRLTIRYVNADGGGNQRPMALDVNGTTVNVPFPITGTGDAGWSNWSDVTVDVTLQAGANAISLTNTVANGPNIDRITVSNDLSADEDGNLNLLGPDTDLRLGSGAAQSMNFRLEGLDLDIVKVEISFDGGATKTVVLPDADGDFTVNTSGLGVGTYTVTAFVTDEVGNTATDTMQVRIVSEAAPFEVVIEAEDLTKVTITDTDLDTVVRTQGGIKENSATEANSGPGQIYDAFGLRPGYSGTGYLDPGNDVGDSFAFSVEAPEAGSYQVTIRYVNADGGGNQRPMALDVNGTIVNVAFPITGTGDAGWSNWTDVTVDVTLQAGANAISLTNTVANGPNIDRITVSNGIEPDTGRVEQRFEDVVKINFQPAPGQTFQGLPAGFVTPEGFLADSGAAYGDRGNGFSYGWVSEESVADGTANGTTPLAQPANAIWYKNTASGATDLQKTYAHFEYPLGGANASRAWEMALENGTYQVTMSIGDTAGPFDSTYIVNVEGEQVTPAWIPANPIDGTTGGGGFRSTLVTKTVQITDGRLTIDSIGGTNTEIQYLEIARIPDLTPGDARSAEQDYSRFLTPQADSLTQGRVDLAIGADGELPVGIDPTGFFVVGVELQASVNGELRRGPNISTVENVKLVETLTGIEVPITVQITAAADSVTIRPRGDLKENTSYTLKVEDVLDLGVVENFDAPIRQFQDVTATFVTGVKPEIVAQPVAFNDLVQLDGFGDGAFGYTSVEFGPDGKLYIATILGEIHRFDLNANGTIDKASRETLTLDYFEIGTGGDRRGIIGIEFDPTDPNVIWISDNYAIPRQDRAFNTPEFSGQISKITLGTGGSFTGATAETYIKGLPRSGGDHLTNSIEFRPNPDYTPGSGLPEFLLYVMQGSNTAAGAPDGGWGFRPERLLNAAVLEIDPTREAPTGGFDVQTEPSDPNPAGGIDPRYQAPLSGFNPDGTYPGFYNPFDADGVLKIFATGVRNAYDLVWHSNGKLYAPTNGTAGGGITPDDPNTAINEGLGGHPTQNDYLFTISEGKYYGHPVPIRGEYILNGGNPTSGKDPNEATGTNSITYPVGVQPDPNYDSENSYSLGLNRSPNGVTEYKSDVFGANLKGAVVFAQFSVGDNVRYVLLNEDGSIRFDDVLRRPNGDVIDEYIDPLDIVQHPTTGQLYLMTLDRATGASQLILLNPAVQGGDTSADEDGNLAVTAQDVTDPSAAVFQVTGLDADIVQVRASFNNAPYQIVTLDAEGRFTLDLGPVEGDFNLRVQVVDDSGNVATTTLPVTVDYPEIPYVPLFSVQAEDNTPDDGTSVVIATGPGAQIVIRDAANPEASTNPAHVDGLWPGAYGVDGNTDSLDGTPGGYADFGNTNNDFITFTFEVSAEDAGDGLIKVRYTNPSDPAGANGGARPLSVTVNGELVTTAPFAPTPGANSNQRLVNWTDLDIPVTLIAGTNTVRLQATANTGPNIDQIEVLIRDTFVPVYAEVIDEARIELEATDGTARTVTPEIAQFYFTVAESGAYALDTIANAGAPNGGGLTYRLNGVEIADLGFPSSTDETTIYADLVAGTEYKLEIRSDQPGANALDYLDVRKAPSDPDADIAIQSLDPAYFDNRLHFSYIENPNSVPASLNAPRDFKETGTVRISNTGTTPLEILEATLEGPFALVDAAGLAGQSIAAGGFLDVTVTFVRALHAPAGNLVNGVFEGALRLRTNDAEDPIVTVDLAGFWQDKDENSWEPNINEVWELFGFGNFIPGVPLIDSVPGNPLNNGDLYEAINDNEILSPYWKIADGFESARITQIAAYHGPGGASMGIHAPGNQSGSSELIFWNHQGDANQTIFPLVGSSNAFPTRVFDRGTIPDAWAGDDIFGIEVANFSTDPTLNPNGQATPQRGHLTRVFEALDKDGNVIPNVYLGIQDYVGINYDYNDNMFVIEGVAPVGNGQLMEISGLDPAAADDRLVFTNIDTKNTGAAITALGGQQLRDTATFTITNDGIAPLSLASVLSNNPAFVVTSAPTTVPAGGSATVTVQFVGTHTGTSAGAEVITGTLTIVSNAFAGGTQTIALAGIAQEFSENNSEPSVEQIVEAFGYSTDMAQDELANSGIVETVGDEVLAPYFVQLDASKPVDVIQLAAFLQVTDVARLGFHGLDSSDVTNLFAQDDQQSQTVSPDGLVTGAGDSGSVARALFTPDGPFGIKISVDGRPTFASWSDPVANDLDPVFGQLINGANADGHLIRYFTAKDAAGNVIPGTYIAIQDYPGAGNFDYNDHMFLIRNVTPHTLTAAEDANGDGINDALQTDADNDGLVAFFDDNDVAPPPQAAFNATATPWAVGPDGLTLAANLFDAGGQGVAWNDTTPGKQPNSGLNRPGTDVDVNNSNGAVGWIANGEWLEYTIDVADAGVYDLSLLLSNGGSVTRSAVVEFFRPGETAAYESTGPIQNAGGGGFNAFLPRTAPGLELEAGVQVVRVTFPNSAGQQDFQSFSLTPANAAPVITSAATASVAENQTFALDVNATDADGDALSYAISGGADAGLFDIDAASGIVTFKSAPNFEAPADAGANNVYNLTVAVSDGTATTSQAVAITVTDVAEQAAFNAAATPWAVGPDGLTLAANLFDAGGQGVAWNDTTPGKQPNSGLNRPGTDVDVNNSNGAVGWIANGEWLEYTIDVADAGVYDLSLLLSNGGSVTRSAVVEFFRPGETAAYESTGPIQNAGGGGFNAFLPRTAPGLELEAGVQVVRVTFPNSAGQQDFQSFSLTPANAAPVITSAATASVAENQTFALDVNATDADGDALSYAISGGADAGLFDIDAASGIVTFKSAPNFEAPADAGANNVYNLTVAVSDGTATTSQAVAITVTDVAEQAAFNATATPWAVGPDGLTLAANLFDAGGQGVAWNDTTPGKQPNSGLNRPGTDVDVNNSNGAVGWIANGEWLEYTIDVADAGVYDLSLLLSNGGSVTRSAVVEFFRPGETAAYESTGPIQNAGGGGFNAFLPRTAPGLELEAGVQVVRVTFPNSAGQQDFQSFSLTPANAAPVITSAATASVAENQTFALDVNATDADGDALSYAISGGADAGLFDIDAASGIVTFKSAPNFEAPADAGANNVYNLTVAVSDGTATTSQAVAITVTDVAEQAAFNAAATPWAVGPDGLTLAANLFDAGGQGVAWNDTTPGKQPNSGLNRPGTDVDVNNSNGAVGWIANGEWLEYTIDVADAGVYDLSLLLSNGGSVTRSAVVEFFRPGETAAYESTGPIQNAGGGGFNAFLPRTAPGLELEAGVQVVRVTFPNSASQQDFQSFSLTRKAFILEDTDTLVFKASSYNAGGQGVAYNDQPGLQGGTNGGREGSDVEVAPTGAVGWINDGEWLEYALDVRDAGQYQMSLSMALGIANATRQVKAEFFADGIEVDEFIFDTPKTGSWTVFENTSGTVQLDEGLAVLRLTFLGGAQDLLSIALTADDLFL
jgi:VCBS repeat-containing protein